MHMARLGYDSPNVIHFLIVRVSAMSPAPTRGHLPNVAFYPFINQSSFCQVFATAHLMHKQQNVALKF
jgi:hypothetical protein